MEPFYQIGTVRLHWFYSCPQQTEVGGAFLLVEQQHVKEDPIFAKDVDMPTEELKTILGDRQAHVTISLEQKDVHYGTGFGAFASVTLTCDQSSEAIQMAGGLANDIAARLVATTWEHSQELYNTLHPAKD